MGTTRITGLREGDPRGRGYALDPRSPLDVSHVGFIWIRDLGVLSQSQ